MTQRAAILLAGTIACSVVVACPAVADVYEVTYTGMASGTDTNGVFGTAGAVFSNVAYTSTYTYDPSRFGTAASYSGPGDAYAYGGSTDGLTSPILSASITIDGNTYNQSSLYYGSIFLNNPSGYGYANMYESAGSSSANYLNDNLQRIGGAAASFTSLQSFAVPSGSGSGNFQYDGEYLVLNETYFAVTDVGSSPPASVPEPESLGLLAGAACVFAAALALHRMMSGRDAGSGGSEAVRQ